MPPASRSKKFSAHLIAAAIAFVVIGAAFFYYIGQPINHDTAWFMYAARGMLAGGKLYQDFIEVNAPMAYYSVMPAAWLSHFVSNEAALTANILAYILLAYILCVAVMRHLKLPAATLPLLQTGLLLIMCFMPGYAFSQREHIFAVLLMPYALAAAMRGENRFLPLGLAIACGAAAGFGASIKPPFLIVPVFIEAAVLMRRRSWKMVLSYDVLAFCLTLAAIYLASFLAYADYWQKILPEAVALYEPYTNFEFICEALLLQVPLFAVGFAAGEYRGRGNLISARWILTGATLGAFALFLLQRKGWPYHAVPLLMFMSALFVFNLADLKTLAQRNRPKAIVRGALSILAIIAAFAIAITGDNVNPDMTAEVEASLKGTNGSFFIMSTGNYPAFPLALNPAYKWASRYPLLVMLPGLIKAEFDGKPSPYATAFRGQILEDILHNKPSTIFLYQPVDAGGVTGEMMIGWFRKDLDFDLEWRANYRYTGTSGPYAVFKRAKRT